MTTTHPTAVPPHLAAVHWQGSKDFIGFIFCSLELSLRMRFCSVLLWRHPKPVRRLIFRCSVCSNQRICLEGACLERTPLGSKHQDQKQQQQQQLHQHSHVWLVLVTFGQVVNHLALAKHRPERGGITWLQQYTHSQVDAMREGIQCVLTGCYFIA